MNFTIVFQNIAMMHFFTLILGKYIQFKTKEKKTQVTLRDNLKNFLKVNRIVFSYFTKPCIVLNHHIHYRTLYVCVSSLEHS